MLTVCFRQHIRPYPNLNDDYTGIPNAIIFALRLGSETNPTLVVSKTDCVGTIVATTSFTLASQFPLYAINTFTVKGTSTLSILFIIFNYSIFVIPGLF